MSRKKIAREKRFVHSLRVQIPRSLAQALEREAERRCATVSALVRMELAKAARLFETEEVNQ